MSILIKGMKMPETCLNCPLETDYGTCGHFNGVDYIKHQTDYNNRPVWCPLIELPPHGKLIDADALLKLIENPDDERYGYIDAFDLANTPTILEAEDGE